VLVGDRVVVEAHQVSGSGVAHWSAADLTGRPLGRAVLTD
jgi:hypothetical protein